MKNSKREKLNLFFSAFLLIGFIVCTYFFMTLANQVPTVAGMIIKVVVYVLFGLLLFYATRVGDGTPIKRFSPIILVVLDIPALYIILATFATGFPFNAALANQPIVMLFASVALGYGLPYTFLSGFELKSDEAVEEAPVSGGIKEELEKTQKEETVALETEEAAEVSAEEKAEETSEISE